MENIYWPIDLMTQPSCRYIGTGVSAEHHNKTYFVPNLWCVHLYDFEGTLTMKEGCLDVHPGDIGFIPPGHTVAYAVYGTGVHLACHFQLAAPGEATYRLPALMPTGARYPEFSTAFRNVLNLRPRDPLAADVKLWSLLLDAERMRREGERRENESHPAVEQCVHHIELNLNRPLRVAELVELAGVSHPYLIRLFKESEGCSITEYIQRRRMEKARHLLTETDQPVKSVAIDCGFTDLHYFNKCVRKAFGVPPRALRE